jgi:DNA-binding NarL/FixJ family response regulator
VLCDVQGLTPEDILARLSEVSNLPQLNTALVDLASDRQLERAAFQMGVKGFFYLGDGPELLFKGLRTMRGGHTWVPRKVLESCLMDTSGRYWRTGGGNGLTRRQEEVLQLLSRGYRNAEIARQLELSTNTVKAHIYQAFKKIKVNSRMQAARWASYNLASRALP